MLKVRLTVGSCTELQVLDTCFNSELYDNLSVARNQYDAEVEEDIEDSCRLRHQLKEGKCAKQIILLHVVACMERYYWFSIAPMMARLQCCSAIAIIKETLPCPVAVMVFRCKAKLILTLL